uniref:Uncharacterized protein n=1 Tax=Myotis myotis TaxID=51298 RepID=A0A7J7RSL4_MYOMY|nr:hypothetical protein mMyoMyo1_010208 [Myotis myotis]
MGSEPRGSRIGAAFNHRGGSVRWDFGGGGGRGWELMFLLAHLAHCPVSPPSLGSHSFVLVMASVGRSPLPLDLNAAVERGKGREMGTISNSASNFLKNIYFMGFFLQRGRERDRELETSMRKKHRSAASCTLPTGDVPTTKVHALDRNRTWDS